jgi:CO/xanthine dehydrogenase Mo-binding subunit
VRRFKVIGKPHSRLDGPDTVTGHAAYTVDVVLPSMLHAKLFRSSVPHAKIKRLDASRACALTGVAAVLTAGDVPRRRFGFTVQDEEICAGEKVRYVGDVIAAVAAVDEETAEHAIDLIDCDYEELPAAFSPDEALKENAPLVHDKLSSYRLNSALARDWHPVPGTNIAHQTVFTKGDIDRGFAEADEIFDDTFCSQQVQHCSLEPHAVVAHWDGNRLTVWTSTQKVFLVRSGLADLFDLAEGQIRVIGTKVGAGFGGKNSMRLEPYATALALKTGNPVRLVNSRAEEFAAAGSVPATVRVRTGVKRDGTITARAMDFTWDTGAYAEGLPGSNRALKDGVGPYKIPDIRVTSTLVYTNKLRGCPFRGLGIPEAVWAVESQMDIIAAKLGIDPVDLRLKNCLDQGDETPAGDRANHIALRDCLLKVSAELKRWKKHAPSNHGFGVALLHKSPTTSAASSNARVRIDAAGRVELFIGATDVGGGTGTSLGQIAAEELSIPLNEVNVVIADTELTPFDHGTYSSRVTPYVGAAVKLAATDARRQLLKAAAGLWNLSPDFPRLVDKKVTAKGRRSMTFAEVIGKSQITEIVGLGSIESKRLWAGDSSGDGKGFTAPGWPFGAQAVEVEVDQETGVVKLIRVASAHDVGQAINPMALTSQIQGGIMMGLGYSLWEGLLFEDGTITNGSFADYKIATARDIPAAIPIIVEKNYAAEPYGAKGVGEMAVFGIAPALANAVAKAAGVRIKDLPMSAEKLLAQIKQSRRSEIP